MATLLRGTPGLTVQVQSIEPVHTATVDTRNITKGPSTLMGVVVDNQLKVTGNTKVWLKLYDTSKNDWQPNGDKAIIGFPVEARVTADDVTSLQALGSYQVMLVNGLRIDHGLSVAASQEAGDASATDPGSSLRVEFVTK